LTGRYLLLYCLYIIVFMIFGYAVGLKYFRKTNIGEEGGGEGERG
jgi:hypothetical protein